MHLIISFVYRDMFSNVALRVGATFAFKDDAQVPSSRTQGAEEAAKETAKVSLPKASLPKMG